MQHRALLIVNAWLILQLVNYGQTDDICGAGKIRRGDKCRLLQLRVESTPVYMARSYWSSEDDTRNECKPVYMATPYWSSEDDTRTDDDNSDNSLTSVKDPDQSPQDNIPNAVREDIPSRDEDNSDQKDRSFNPPPGDDRCCQCAVGGDTDGNDTASSINNDNDVNLLNYQPSSEHNSQQRIMVIGLRSFDLPVQNPDANLPHLPHYHGGSSDEDDSGFQN